jgi:uncharacterized protein (TIGR02266 family)
MPSPPKPPPLPPSERRSAIRVDVVIPIRLRYDSVLDFVETQSMNISRTGMFIVTEAPAPLGSCIEFEFALTDGFVLLNGLAEVVRVAQGGIVEGMGVRFLDLDATNQAVIDRIVAVNTDEGRVSTLTFDFSRPATEAQIPIVTEDLLEIAEPASKSPAVSASKSASPSPSASTSKSASPSTAGARAAPPNPELPSKSPKHAPLATSPKREPLAASPKREPLAPPSAPPPPAPPPLQFDGLSLRLVLGRDTVHHFTSNPLVNVRSGGLMVPAEKQVPLGTVFAVSIVDEAGNLIVSGNGKVVTKQDLRVGIRLVDVPKEALARLQAEVGKLAPAK